MAISRYTKKNGELVKSDDGDWVKYEDVKNLIEAELKKLAKLKAKYES